MNVLSVRGLCKRYGSFALRDVSFDVAPGSITGFIGRNGAGKTTTLKSLLDFVHPDAGEALFFGRPLSADEFGVKQAVGFASGGFGFYPLKRLRTVTDVTRRFYPSWDETAYRRYLALFALDENKRVKELSEGMKVKYALALALSHRCLLYTSGSWHWHHPHCSCRCRPSGPRRWWRSWQAAQWPPPCLRRPA